MLDALIRDALCAPANATGYVLHESLLRAYPDDYVFMTGDPSFDIDTFVARTDAKVFVHDAPAPQEGHRWRGPGKGILSGLDMGRRTVSFEGRSYEVFSAVWTEGSHLRMAMTWIVGPDRQTTLAFAERVAEVANEVRGEVLVFANGCWSRSVELHGAIRGSTFENLVLPPGMIEELRSELEFLKSRDRYAHYGAPWKRGVLLVGPPGNGKTHCIKALLNHLRIPCLYVQSFEAPYTNPQRNVAAVFERARRTTPCALVLEDLDSLLTETTRSFFLNELDGFARNEGILTLATTNHPERLDPAIADRPSRFDRKYNFDLPAESERLAYLELWNGNVEGASRLSHDGLREIAEATDGFSFAYVKELMLSSLMKWVSHQSQGALLDVVRRQVAGLAAQMKSAPSQHSRTRIVEEYGDETPDRGFA